MTFAVKSQLMALVQNDAVAYGLAFEFVQDSADKLQVFQQAFNEQQHNPSVEAKASAAAGVAKARWLIMYPAEAK